MRKRLYGMLVVIVLLMVVASLDLPILVSDVQDFGRASSKTMSVNSDEIRVDMWETVSIHSSLDSCNLSLVIRIGSSSPLYSPLADYYREALNFKELDMSDTVPVNERPDIPEFLPLNHTIKYPEYDDCKVTKISCNVIAEDTPAREQFLNAVRQEHLYSLGINITEWNVYKMWGQLGPVKESCFLVQADAELLQVHSSDGTKEIAIGPENLNASFARAGLILTKIVFIQQMLNHSDYESNGDWSYKSNWTMCINLPPDKDLNNTLELSTMDPWNVDFGGNTSMNASIKVATPNQVVLTDTMNVTKNPINKTEEELLEQGLLCYKVFHMEVNNPTSTYSESKCACGIGGDWHMSWSLTLWEGEHELKFNEPTDITLNVYAQLVLEGYVGWNFKLQVWPPDVYLKGFEAWMSIEPTLRVNATVAVDFQHTWSKELYEWKSDLQFFHLLGVLGWYETVFTATAVLDVDVDSGVRITCEANATGRFKAGVRWKRHGGWSKIYDASLLVERTGPEVDEGNVKATITPSVEFELAVIFYSTAGPSVKFIPYATLDVDTGVEAWYNITVGLRVTAGVTFSDWLADVLDLDGWQWQLLNHVFWKDPPWIRDVAVTDVRTPKKAFVTEPIIVYVDVLNKGNFTENNVNVTLSYENGGQPVEIGCEELSLPIGNSTTIAFPWNTTGLSNGTYTIEAVASIPAQDNDTSNDKGENFTKLEIQNVAIVDVTTSKCVVFQGRTVDICVTVMNKGSVNVSALLIFVYYNKTPISKIWCGYMRVVFDLKSGASETLRFRWDTTGVDDGTYTISANASLLPYEIDPDDNTKEDGTVRIDLVPPAHDVGCCRIEIIKNEVYYVNSVPINVSVCNYGLSTEIVIVDLFYRDPTWLLNFTGLSGGPITVLKNCTWYNATFLAGFPEPCSWWHIIEPVELRSIEFHVDSVGSPPSEFHIDEVLVRGNSTSVEVLPPVPWILAEREVPIGSEAVYLPSSPPTPPLVNCTTVTFTLNTKQFEPNCSYAFYFVAHCTIFEPFEDEDPCDNKCCGLGAFYVKKLLGDIDLDGYVGPIDANMFLGAYGTSVGHPCYKVLADLWHDELEEPVPDGYIGSFDMSMFGAQYGEGNDC